ncbi:probable Rho GTPase-activating protein CG5521 isoform X1 [Rhodnius prolixus]|uniref:probable Rho GTPase-activating protein CG5521 isoform X1 n=1 Tax=Rhodnius prolixus TaxID=13249 RepID=UPI003D18C065
MFSKKLHADIKKSTLKLQDPKKDSATRFKHLRIILEHVDLEEAKTLFESNYSHIYFVLYECFITAETNLRQKELPFHLVHKAHREELEAVLFVLDKLLTLLPELISKRWQSHSLTRLITKLLHPGNSHKLRREAIRYFLLWYQILGDSCTEEIHAMFATLIPGFLSPFPDHPGLTMHNSMASTFFNDSHHGPLSAIEILPIYPPQSGDKYPEDGTKFFMDALMEYIVTQVSRVEWKDKLYKQHKCFTFLFERFKQFYLPHIFPTFSSKTNLFTPYLEIPSLRTKSLNDSKQSEIMTNCKVAVIKWVANFTHLTKAHPVPQIGHSASVTPSESEGERSPGSELRRVSVGQAGCDSAVTAPFNPPYDIHLCEDPNMTAFQIVRDVLYWSRENVNFIHEIYRQAFLLNFTHSPAIRRAISVYKDWIQMTVIELPPFMLEPVDPQRNSGPSSCELQNTEGLEENIKLSRLRNDYYLAVINKENMLVRAGLQNVLQVFITDAANVFLLEVNSEMPKLLEDQVDICKRVLNIYRYMVMHTLMEAKTWEQLLIVLLHITSLILSPNPPKKKEETLGGRLSPAIFQTLIVTWIKANLNVVISRDLWDQFFQVLSSLTQWEELIKEWAKTIETLTRVLGRHVYGVDLTDLPLDRLSEQKAKRQRRGLTRATNIDKVDLRQTADSDPPTTVSTSLTNNNPVMEKEVNSCSRLRRSASETNLLWRRKKVNGEALAQLNGAADISGGSAEVDELDVSHLSSQDNPSLSLNRRWRSLEESFTGHCHYYDSECATRSPSPAPSSGVESNSFKDSPIQIDVLSTESSTLDSTGQDGKSVMGGGSIRGWLPDVAAILWLRMLGALGDVNKIQDPALHAHVFQFLNELFETLSKIRLNQGIPGDNQSTPQPPELVPPITIVAPWCFNALSLPDAYHRGKLLAYRLLCNITITTHDVPLHSKHLSLFYSTLHNGLQSTDQTIVNMLIKHCGSRFFSLHLPGFSLLFLDFIHATNTIISTTEIRNTPRMEAVSILGAMLSFPEQLMSLPVLQPSEDGLIAAPCPNLRDQVLNLILKAGKTEVSGVARCIALSNLGIFLYQELCKNRKHCKIKEAINTLLLALRFNHKIVAQTATDILLLLCDHSEVLLKIYPEIPPRIVEVLIGTLSHLMPIGDTDKRLLTSLVFCLGEWTMNIPIKRLVHEHNGNSLLSNIFKVLDELSEGGHGRAVQVGSFHPDLVQEFCANIRHDDLSQEELTQLRRPTFPASSLTPHHLISTAHSVQLAANLVISHLVNNLGHFPLTSGGANLGSLVVEQDDLAGLSADQLSTQLFSAPNIQILVTSVDQLISLVEVPALSVTGGCLAELITAASQVRLIVRDLAGKACWDASILYGTQLQCANLEECGVLNIAEELEMPPVMNSLCVSSLPQDTLRHRAPNILPTQYNSAEDMDNLDDLLQYIGYTSPEVLESLDIPRNVPAPSFNVELENDAMSSILSMRIVHNNCIMHSSSMPIEVEHREQIGVKNDLSPFQYCRLLFSQFGMHGWDMRSQLYLVDKSDKLLREIRNLDSQRCRQTHKIAVIYVAYGQEDKNSILSNSGGSQAYEEFIAGLAWEVELETHTGFMGGLQRNKMTGVTAPYYATSLTEVIFHVSTRMPSNNAEAVLQKTRHLGNDEVHIVWSEHTRDYRRGIIPTEFCDVLIVIYPLPHNLYRIQVSRKSDVPYFGPLYNEAVIGHRELPGLVRATALSASRAKRSVLPFYQQYYEERGRSLETVIKNYKKSTTFEEFAANIYSPTLYLFNDTGQTNRNNLTSLQNLDEGSTSSAGSTTSSTLAALLDSTTHKLHSPLPGDDSNNWLGSELKDEHSVAQSGISPRPHKKSNPGKSSHHYHHRRGGPHLTPPDSPTSRRSK